MLSQTFQGIEPQRPLPGVVESAGEMKFDSLWSTVSANLEEIRALTVEDILCDGAGTKNMEIIQAALESMPVHAGPAIFARVGEDNLLDWPFDFPSPKIWTKLEEGQSQMYAMENRGNGQVRVEVLLNSAPAGCVNFAVATQDNLNAWRDGQNLEGIGQGTENPYNAADVSWASDLVPHEILYLYVENQACEPGGGFYFLNKLGDGVILTPLAPGE
jgi:hypothetical protein